MKHSSTGIIAVLAFLGGVQAAIAGSILVLPPSTSKIEVIGISKMEAMKMMPRVEIAKKTDGMMENSMANKDKPRKIPATAKKKQPMMAAKEPAMPPMELPVLPVVKASGTEMKMETAQ